MAEKNTHEISIESARDAPRGAALGRLSILLAAALWSTSGWFAKNPTFDAWPDESRGLLLAFWRALFAGLLILPLARRPRWQPRLVPMTLSFALMNGTYLSAMVLTTAANAIWLQSTAPFWVFLIGTLLLGEQARREDLILLAFGMLGVGTILALEIGNQQLPGVVLGLLSGVFYGSVVLFMRSLRSENSAWLVSLNLLVTAAALAPYLLYCGIWPSASQLVTLAGFGLFQMGLPYVLFAHGLRTVSSQEATGIALLEPILMPVWVFWQWGEAAQWWTLVGGALILLGLAVRYLRPPFRRAP